jgi:long-chain acyl-CoA synthetase
VPLSHAYGIEHLILGPVWIGSRVHACRGFDRNLAADQLEHEGISVFPGVPFMYEVLAQFEGRRACPRARIIFTSGAPLPRAVSDAMRERWGVTLGHLYGASELASTTFNFPDHEGYDPGSVGLPVGEVDVRVLDPADPQPGRPLPTGSEGHVAVKSPSMFSGYLGGEPAPVREGYFLTGDLGRFDRRGALTITGRIKLLIDIGALKVNPLEVERVLMEHPAVAECIVGPVTVSQTILRLKAYVTLRPGVASVDVEDLRAFARARLTGYKVPRLFEVLPRMPKTPAGKIDRRAVVGGAAGE